jgi:hypothetical protein
VRSLPLRGTTPNPSSRRERETGADDADEMFSKLMGDVVEPRREFIPRWKRMWMLRGVDARRPLASRVSKNLAAGGLSRRESF